jgi:predicted enzyme related to lactoylglutathione lyase
MITAIAFTVYPVRDMARARGFYEGVLGLRATYNYQDEWVEYDVGPGTFALTTTEMGHQPGARGAVVGFEVEDLDRCVTMLKGKAVPFVLDIFETPVCRLAVIEDPDGNHLTVHRRKT